VAENQELLDDIFSELPENIDTITAPDPITVPDPITAPEPVSENAIPAMGGGLAGAIARSRIIKQEKEKTLRERMQAAPIKKI